MNLKIPKIVKVRSYTNTDIFYSVDLENYTCTCPAFKYKNIDCKHLIDLKKK